MARYLKQALIFTPIFLLLYGTNTYGLHALSLYENPLGQIDSEQWVQESPIQFFIGFLINLLIKDTLITHWLVVLFGFIYLLMSAFYFDKKYFSGKEILKILYFTPFFLVLFTWMGKPDTFTIGSLFFLIAFKDSKILHLVFTIILIFSHPQIAIIYFLLTKYLKIYHYKTNHYISIISGYALYFSYFNQLSDFESRYGVISNELDRVFKTIFTNTLGGLISLFMWLWVLIFLSKLIKDRKFLISFLVIFFVSFFTIDHTRVFIQLAIPIIVYAINQKKFIDTFDRLFDKKIMYILGVFQIQKRADGRLVDGINLYDLEFFSRATTFLISFIDKYVDVSSSLSSLIQ